MTVLLTIFLVFLLVLAIAGLGALGFHTLQLTAKVANLNGELVTQRTRCEMEIKQQKDLSETIKAQYQGVVKTHNEGAKKWNDSYAAMKAEIQRLSKWKNIADADSKAADMIRTARATLERANVDAAGLVSESQQRAANLHAEANQAAAAELAIAKETAGKLASEAREKAKSLKNEAEAILSSATIQAATIIDAANKKAEEIAGSAYDAMKNASHYEQTVKAMKNLIEGYGDQYIIPEQSLLDDLADDFSHAKAGQELKRARECTKVMIRNGTAAACDYVETNRRETAVNFVVDAFNGKVDSILSRTKHDNAGKLNQQIRDAFTLVNFNGKAFRDARVTDEYLAARLDELKWAEVAQQIALQEREEQRDIKEQAREEARAAKEIERALREASKTEELLRKAIEQAQEQFDHASGEQRAMYEERLQEMNDKLKQAIEGKERARSNAEQTKRGNVYIISNIGSLGEDMFKIGLTRRWDPFDRVRELGDSSVPFEFDVHAMIFSEDAPALEQQLHKHFVLQQVNKVNHRKEFFRVSLKAIKEEIEKLGITTGIKWTMTSEAKDYRESLAIEKAIKEDPSQREAWIKRQLNLELIAKESVRVLGSEDEEE